ncbi:UNVERIFIED_CONTAM: hypothetical protein K2H54_006798 [Gekko kuhli]
MGNECIDCLQVPIQMSVFATGILDNGPRPSHLKPCPELFSCFFVYSYRKEKGRSISFSHCPVRHQLLAKLGTFLGDDSPQNDPISSSLAENTPLDDLKGFPEFSHGVCDLP